jgi:hypothetical protein
MWKRHWQHEDGAWEKVRGMVALEEGGKKGGGGQGGTHWAWQAPDRGRRERNNTCSPNLV